jgi:hypothetical protein
VSAGRALSSFSIASPPGGAAQQPGAVRDQPVAPAQHVPVQAAETRPVPSPPVQRAPEPGFVTLAQNPPPVVQSSPAPAQHLPPPPPPPSQASPPRPPATKPSRQQPARTAEVRPAGRGRVADLADVLEALDEPAAAPARGARGNSRLAARDAKSAAPRETDRDPKGTSGRSDGKGDAKRESKSDAKGGRDKDRTARGSRTAAADETETGGKRKKAAPAPKEPSRYWVQVAGGANKDTLPRAFAQVKSKAPKLLGGRGVWTVPNRATNRVLVGPFASSDEAQDFVNKLGKSDVSAFTFTSESGQKVEKLPPK